MLRGHAGVPAHVLVLSTLGAAERRWRPGRRTRARAASPAPAPRPVVTARATLVAAEPFASAAAADAWRGRLDPAAEAHAAVRVLNGVLHAQRTAAADPFVREVRLADALVARVGVGDGEQVAHGRWSDAVEVPRDQPGRGASRSSAVLRPQERLAAVLGGRDVALAAEELTLRARLDLDAGRTREAALQLRIALECALSELSPWSGDERVGHRLGALRAERATVGEAANAALAGGLDAEVAGEVTRVLALVESALRARTVVGLQ